MSLLSVCQTGISLLMQTSLLLLIGLTAAALLQRKGPVFSQLIHRSTLLAVAVCVLGVMLPNGGLTRWKLRLPSSDRVSNGQPATETAGRLALQPSPPGVSFPKSAAAKVEATNSGVVPENALKHTSPPDVKGAQVEIQIAALKPSGDNQHSNRRSWLYIAPAFGWVAGGLVLGIWLAAGYLGIQRLARQAVPVTDAGVMVIVSELCRNMNVKMPRIAESESIQSVFIAGIARPIILLPATYRTDFDEQALRGVLAHEMAHIQRKDGAWALAARILCIVLWVQPLIWPLLKKLEESSEEVCDIEAVNDGCSPASYAETLVRLADRIRPTYAERVAGTGITGFRSSLGKRVQKLLRADKRPSLHLSKSVSLMGPFIAGCTAIAGASLLPITSLLPLETLETDARLAKTVRISAEGIALSELLPKLTERLGVGFGATREMADEKLVILGPPRPLRAILVDVAALYNAHWVPTADDSGKTRYILTKDLKTRQFEDRLAQAAYIRLLEQLQALVAAVNDSPQKLAQRPESDSIRKALSTPGGRNTARIFSLLTPAQRQQLIDQWSVSLPVSKMDDSMKSGIEYMFHGKLFEKVYPNGIKVEEIPREEMDKYSVSFDLLGGWGSARDSGFMSVMLTSPKGFNAEVLSLANSAKFVLPPHGNPYTGEQIDKQAALPDSEVSNKAADQMWADRMKTLAEKSGVSIVSDYYRSKPIVVASDETDQADLDSKIQALDKICRPSGYLWWVRGKTLLFRKRDWYNQKQFEVPDWWVVKLAASVNAHGGVPTYGDVFSLLDLSMNQLIGAVESTGGFADKNLMRGAPEYLAAARGTGVAPTKSIWSGQIRDIETGRKASLIANLSDPRQRKLMSDFETVSGRHIVRPDSDLSDVGYLIMPNYLPGQNPQADSVQVSLNLHLGKGSVGAGYLLRLPLKLPDDRRDKTVIETQ